MAKVALSMPTVRASPSASPQFCFWPLEEVSAETPPGRKIHPSLYIMHVPSSVRLLAIIVHSYGFNVPNRASAIYNQIICLLKVICNVPPPSHKAINLFQVKRLESPFSPSLQYCSGHLTYRGAVLGKFIST